MFYGVTHGGEIIRASNCDNSIKNVRCILCNQNVTFRKQHYRHNSLGTPYAVRAHFMHHGKNNTCNYSNESALHKAAKAILFKHKVTLGVQCVQCSNIVPLNIGIKGTPILEYKWKQYRIDVAYTTIDNTIQGFVEIFVTSRISSDKKTAIQASKIPWCEVSANDILEAYQKRCMATVIDHNASNIKDILCTKCFTQNELQMQKAEEKKLKHHEITLKKLRLFVDHWKEAKSFIDSNEVDLCNKLSSAVLSHLKEEDYDISIHEAIEKRISDPDGVLNFGKYIGCHIEELWESDENTRNTYVRWLAGYTGAKTDRNYPEQNHSLLKGNSRKYMKRARCLLKGSCIVCFEEVDDDWRSWCRTCFRNI